MAVIQQTQGYTPTDRQKAYAYRLACDILDIQQPKPNIKKGYSED